MAFDKAFGVRKPDYHYVFLKQHHSVHSDVPFVDKGRGDIFALPASEDDYEQFQHREDCEGVAFLNVASVVVCEPEEETAGAQLALYLDLLFEARPEMVGTYALWACPEHYQILWSDASGMVASEFIDWGNREPLKQYVWSLYVPPKAHVLFDKSIVRQPGGGDLWTITISTGTPEVYRNLTRTFIGSSWGRRTNVFASQEKDTGLVVVKVSFPDSESCGREVRALQAIHGDAIFPGVVRLLRSDDDSEASQICTAPVNESKVNPPRISRHKARSAMGSTGEDLLMARSVLDILKAVYDSLEIHRALLGINILHRNISIYNILIYPKHNPTTMNNKKLVENSPVFIRQVLKGKKRSRRIDMSSALLIDFDNCAEARLRDGEDNHPLTQRTGTPMFIARSVAQRMVLGLPTIQRYLPMPLLGKEARELYEASYGAETYQRFCDGGQTVHGVIPFPESPPVPPPVTNKKRDDEIRGNADEDDSDREEDPGKDSDEEDSGEEDGKNQSNSVRTEEPSDFHHRPEHDVESIFWVLFYTLIQANPRHSKKEVDNASRSAYWQILSHFHNHHIFDNVIGDSRDIVLCAAPRQIESMLHPKLRSLSGMLKAMIEQINPEYGHLPPKGLDQWHLHEAMRRILLEQIVKMKKKSIPLQPGNPRPGPPEIIPQA